MDNAEKTPTDGKTKTAAAEQNLFNFSLLFQSVWAILLGVRHREMRPLPCAC